MQSKLPITMSKKESVKKISKIYITIGEGTFLHRKWHEKGQWEGKGLFFLTLYNFTVVNMKGVLVWIHVCLYYVDDEQNLSKEQQWSRFLNFVAITLITLPLSFQGRYGSSRCGFGTNLACAGDEVGISTAASVPGIPHNREHDEAFVLVYCFYERLNSPPQGHQTLRGPGKGPHFPDASSSDDLNPSFLRVTQKHIPLVVQASLEGQGRYKQESCFFRVPCMELRTRSCAQSLLPGTCF